MTAYQGASYLIIRIQIEVSDHLTASGADRVWARACCTYLMANF